MPRRFKLAVSDDEEETHARTQSSNSDEERRSKRKRKNKLQDEEEDEEEKQAAKDSQKKKKSKQNEASESENDDKEEEDGALDAKPVGESVRSSGKGRKLRHHFKAFEYDGFTYKIDDPVLLVPEEQNQKPYVAIIKDIMQDKDGSVMLLGQWFYRPEEAEKKGGGNWNSSDTRELFYSFHRDEVAAESVMHKCVVHFIPLNKQIPKRKDHPGFIVQRVYDTEQRKLFKLTDKDYEDSKQHEIDILVQDTFRRLGDDLQDIETEDAEANQEDQMRNKRLQRRKNMAALDVSRVDEETTKSGPSGQLQRAETPGSCNSNASEYYMILANFKVLTGESQRDRWLEKLLQGIQFICTPSAGSQVDGKEKVGTAGENVPSTEATTVPGETGQNGKPTFLWPDSAVPAIAALEKASHEALSSDFQKYNKKMRQLQFNLKNNAQLSRRLLNGELEPSKILNMTPTELKDGLTAEEIASNKPEESTHMQMTDARCKRCMEKKVGLLDIIQAGHGDRYQLECMACGNTWWASRDEASSLTIDGPSSRNVGTAPLATAKFEDAEKLVSPREPEKSAGNDLVKKTAGAKTPVLDNQRSFNKPQTEDNVAATPIES